MKYLLILAFVFNIFVNGQQVNKTDSNQLPSDTLKVDSGEKDSLEIYKPTINEENLRYHFCNRKIVHRHAVQ
jgi:hypothetical protein